MSKRKAPPLTPGRSVRKWGLCSEVRVRSMSVPDYRPRAIQANSWRFRPRERKTSSAQSSIKTLPPARSGQTRPVPDELRFLSRLVDMSYGHFGPCCSAQPLSIGRVESAQDSIFVRAVPTRANRTTYPAPPSCYRWGYLPSPPTSTVLSVLGASTVLLFGKASKHPTAGIPTEKTTPIEHQPSQDRCVMPDNQL